MSNDTMQILLAGLFIVLCFAIGAFLTTLTRKPKRRRPASGNPESLPLSAFSTLNHPALENEAGGRKPLAEAEVFMIYGQRAKAQAVLKKALAKRQVGRAEVDAFWSRYPADDEQAARG